MMPVALKFAAIVLTLPKRRWCSISAGSRTGNMALPKSAEFLRELRAQFGNLGLAAAAYNAGPQRVQDWLRGKRTLPS